MNLRESEEYLNGNGLIKVSLDVAKKTHVDTHRLCQCAFKPGDNGELYHTPFDLPVTPSPDKLITQQDLDALIDEYRYKKHADAFATYLRPDRTGAFIFCKRQ